MIQRESRFPGALAPCPGCGRQPYHVEHGSKWHSLECHPCKVDTGKHASVQEAVAAWEQAAAVTCSPA